MKSNLSQYLQVFFNRKILSITLLGFFSGLPLALTSGTLQAWLVIDGVDIKTIGIFAFIGLPYTIKFLWSPLIDRFTPSFIDRRRGWMIICQICLIVGIISMAFVSPRQDIYRFALFAFIVAFASASQDIVIDAYRTDILSSKERGAGAAIFVTGYRIALLISGALALILSEHIGWRMTYLLMAGVMSIGILTSLFAPSIDNKIIAPNTLKEAVIGPLIDFFSKNKAIIILVFISLYKLTDAYAGSLTTAFLIKEMGFSPTDVGTINKGLGLASLILGSMIGATLMIRLGLFYSLLLFGILQAVSNFLFMLLAIVGKKYTVLILVVAIENLCGGMGTTAFMAFLMALCNQRFSATQYALLSSLAALGRIFIVPSSGFIVESVGWINFFFITILLSIPSLIILLSLKTKLLEFKKEG